MPPEATKAARKRAHDEGTELEESSSSLAKQERMDNSNRENVHWKKSLENQLNFIDVIFFLVYAHLRKIQKVRPRIWITWIRLHANYWQRVKKRQSPYYTSTP
jgi:hypothetical protein